MPLTLRLEGQRDIENPAWEEVERAIRQLDGEKVTTLSLGDFRKENYLGIGGGGEGRYIVFVTYANLDCHTLVNPAGTEEEYEFVIGRQGVSYKDRECHGLETVLKAAKTYHETGDRDKSMHWENC